MNNSSGSTGPRGGSSSHQRKHFGSSTLDLGWNPQVQPRIELDSQNGISTLRVYLPNSVTKDGPDGKRISVLPSVAWANGAYHNVFDSIDTHRAALDSFLNEEHSRPSTQEQTTSIAKQALSSLIEGPLQRSLTLKTADADFSPKSDGTGAYNSGGLCMLSTDPVHMAFELHMDVKPNPL